VQSGSRNVSRTVLPRSEQGDDQCSLQQVRAAGRAQPGQAGAPVTCPDADGEQREHDERVGEPVPNLQIWLRRESPRRGAQELIKAYDRKADRKRHDRNLAATERRASGRISPR
jgi:hypothetical protein